MSELDLSGIDPLRRDEVRRRIEVLDRYLAIKHPKRTDAQRHADEIGIGIAQFYRLAKTWRLHRKPQMVGAGERGRPRTRRDGVPPKSRSIVAEVIDELGADAKLADLLREVARRCEAAGTVTPSRGALWTYVMDSRATSRIRTDEPRRIVVGRFWAELPTVHGGGTMFPEVAIALLLPKRTITGTDISLDPGKRASAALALARAFATMGDVPADLQVEVSVADREEVLPVHLARLGREPVRAGRSTGTTIVGNLGRMVGGMRIRHRPHTANPERLLAARAVAPLDRDAAGAEVEHAIRRHNTALSGSAAAAEPI
ncbi:hypothetical protein [uncultured Sphingomonas sp.]|uniref:hypothetical protein n=1 Tax=uncultured Sphingomonas sp. TaxID=158754 RepID=UPI0025E4D76B|nr:hypothetical protein [uncultured Sphingomonas sp.]